MEYPNEVQTDKISLSIWKIHAAFSFFIPLTKENRVKLISVHYPVGNSF